METTERALDHDYHFEGSLYEASETSQEVPKPLAERDRQLSDEEGEEGIPDPLDVSNGLPTAISKAARSTLEKNAIDTWEGLLAAYDELETLEELEGVGPSRAQNIATAIEQVRSYHVSDEE